MIWTSNRIYGQTRLHFTRHMTLDGRSGIYGTTPNTNNHNYFISTNATQQAIDTIQS